jgi:hypothetical protein
VRSIHVTNLTAALFLSACAGSIPEPPYSPQPEESFEEIQSPPPPARVEVVPARPKNPNAVWLDGEWDWTGTRWAWQFGRWVALPPGATYAKWETKRRADGVLIFAPGAFRDPKGRELEPPAAIAIAHARDEEVIDVEGRTERTGPNVTPERTTPARQ